MADDLDQLQVDQQRQPDEESVVERWRRRQQERAYKVYKINARRRSIVSALITSIIERRAQLYGRNNSQADAPAKKRRYHRRKF